MAVSTARALAELTGRRVTSGLWPTPGAPRDGSPRRGAGSIGRRRAGRGEGITMYTPRSPLADSTPTRFDRAHTPPGPPGHAPKDRPDPAHRHARSGTETAAASDDIDREATAW